jgi:hypothetical protein
MAFSLQDRTPRIAYTVAVGDFQSVFTFPFEYFEAADIVALVDDGSTVTTMTDGSGFTLTGTASSDGIGFESGSLELDTRITDSIITIYRDMVIDRLQQHPATGIFNIKSLNTALSRIFAIAQEQRLDLARTFRLAPEDQTTSLLLPDATTRANKYLYFDALGQASASDEVADTGLVTISAIMVPVVGAATAATALSLLDGGDKGAANIWTALNTFQATVRIDSTGGTTAILRDTTTGHNSNTAELDFSMQSNAGTYRDFGKISVGSPTVGDGVEDGFMNLRVREDGSLVTYLGLDGDGKKITAGAPIQLSAPGTAGQVLTSAGAGTPAIMANPTISQILNSWVTATKTTTTVIPYDNTLPQNTEGEEVTTLAITPVSATSTLMIQWQVYIGQEAENTHLIAALFQDATADALHAESVWNGQTGTSAGNHGVLVTGVHTMTSGGTSEITFKLRYGSDDATTCYANSMANGNPLFGAAGPRSGMTITEILP